MKRVIIYFFIIIITTFLIPILFTIKFQMPQVVQTNDEEQAVEAIEEETPIIKEYDYKEFGTIKLLHKETGDIEEMKLDEYIYGVVSAEMPANYEMEALKAQAIVARTYTVYKIKTNGGKHEGADICDDSACCQAWISKEKRLEKWDEEKREEYWIKIVTAVDSTAGKIITYEGEPINAFFHSNSGGKTEIPLNVWGGSGYPYLQVVETSGEDAYSQYSSEVEITKDELISKIKENHSNFEIDFEKDDAIKILEYTDSGRIKSIKFGNVNLSGVEVRTVFGLRSANFNIEINDNSIKFKVIGYGHGVGMSQTGADALAKQDNSCEDIIKHYYVGVEIVDL